MKRAQHAAYNPKFEKMGLFRRSGREKIKGSALVVEGDHHLTEKKTPAPTHNMAHDLGHNKMTWDVINVRLSM